MATREERRKKIKELGVKNKSLQQWEQEFMRLPAIIKFLLASHATDTPISIITFLKAKKDYPEYWNEKGEFEPIKW